MWEGGPGGILLSPFEVPCLLVLLDDVQVLDRESVKHNDARLVSNQGVVLKFIGGGDPNNDVKLVLPHLNQLIREKCLATSNVANDPHNVVVDESGVNKCIRKETLIFHF